LVTVVPLVSRNPPGSAESILNVVHAASRPIRDPPSGFGTVSAGVGWFVKARTLQELRSRDLSGIKLRNELNQIDIRPRD
jgi:hypothetical protein